MQTKRVLFSGEAEAAILSCVMLDSDNRNKDATEDIFTTLTFDDFSQPEFQKLFLFMKKLFDKGVDIDLVNLVDMIERAGKFNEVGGIENITRLSTFLPCNVNYQNYIQILKDYSRLRALNRLTDSIYYLIEEGKTAETIKSEIEKQLEDMQSNATTKSIRHIEAQAQEILQHIKDVKNGKYDDFGLATGFATLDRLLWGLQKSELYIIAARAGAGKTAFGINVLNHVAKKNKVLFFSQEMSEREILYRMFAHETDIALPEVRRAKGLTDAQITSLDLAADTFTKGKFFIDDSTSTVPEMLLKAKRLKRKEGLDLVVVDYLQFVKPTNKSGNRTQEVGDIARDLKRMSKVLEVPVIALCQLNRQLDNEDREPTLADLRESGEIENNADVVMFLTNVGSKLEKVRKMELTIAKHRNGALAKVKFQYRGETFTFTEEKSEQKKSSEPALTPTQEELPF